MRASSDQMISAPSRASLLVAHHAGALLLLLGAACSAEPEMASAAATTPAADASSAVVAADVPTYADFLSRDAALRCEQLGQLCASFGQDRLYACDDVLPADVLGQQGPGTYAPEGAAACLNESTAGGLSARLARSEGGGRPGSPTTAVPSACDGVFRGPAFGTVALGEPCVLHSDCAALPGGRASCAGVEPELRRCQGVLAAELGDVCNDKSDPAGLQRVPSPGIVCDSLARRFVRAPGLDEACVSGQCGTGMVCRMGLCAAPTTDGLACLTRDDCASSRCSAGICAPLGKKGASCATGSDCASTVCEAGACGRTFVYRYVCD